MRESGAPTPARPRSRAESLRSRSFASARAQARRAPHVLFAWSQAGGAVPFERERQALLDALDPWWPEWVCVEPSRGTDGIRSGASDATRSSSSSSAQLARLLELPHASLRSIQRSIELAWRSGHPITHAHVLSHATPRTGAAASALRLDACERADPAEATFAASTRLTEPAGWPDRVPAIVTLAICAPTVELATDRGARAAHELNERGVPVVVAGELAAGSYVSGSWLASFYAHLLAGGNLSNAVRAARDGVRAVTEQGGAAPPWRDYANRSTSAAGSTELHTGTEDSALRAVLHRCEQVLMASHGERSLLEVCVDRLDTRIRRAELALPLRTTAHARIANPEAHGRAAGAIAAAAKCRAELRARLGVPDGVVRADLSYARTCFREALSADPADYGHAVEALALEAVLAGGVASGRSFEQAWDAARSDRGDLARSLGARIELSLLASFAGASPPARPLELLTRLASKATAQGWGAASVTAAQRGLRRQLERYARWWTCENDYFGARGDLRHAACGLLARWPFEGPDAGPDAGPEAELG